MLNKLTITRCEVSSRGNVTTTSDLFKTAINPSDLKRNFSISYSDKNSIEPTAIGKSAKSPKFKSVDSQTLSFSLVIDGTGVVEASKGISVTDQIAALADVVYEYRGDKHEPSVVEVSWGAGMVPFTGRLTSLNTDYTLFQPDGEPLRAKVGLNFTSFLSLQEEGLQARRSSPDLTHRVMVEAGDTLPLLCKRIYDDPFQYLFVARKNQLTSFRELRPGTVLSFPPLVE